jgi:hypothetical protein
MFVVCKDRLSLVTDGVALFFVQIVARLHSRHQPDSQEHQEVSHVNICRLWSLRVNVANKNVGFYTFLTSCSATICTPKENLSLRLFSFVNTTQALANSFYFFTFPPLIYWILFKKYVLTT